MSKQNHRAREEGDENGAAKFQLRSPVITACLVVIALCIGGFAFSYLKSVISPLLIALFIYFLTNPIVRFFQARKYSPAFAYVSVLLMTIVAFLGIGIAIFGNLEGINRSLGNYQTKIEGVINKFSSPIMQTLEFLGIENETDPSAAKPPPNGEESGNEAERDTKKELISFLSNLFKQASGHLVNHVIGTSLEFFEIAILTIFYLFFILIEAHKLPQRIKRGFDYESTQTLREMGTNIQRSIEQYLRVKTGVSAGLGLTTGLLGMLFGLDFWLLWAGFLFLANYVTYIGSMVALVPPIAIAFLQFDSLPAAIFLSALLIANRFFWIDYVEIKLSGQQLNVSPVILLLSIGLFGALWGVIGMVLAVPLVTSVKIALSQFDSTSHLASLLSED